MLYRRYVPQPPLSHFVHLIWLYKGDPRAHKKERILPDGSVELIVNLRENQVRFYDRTDPNRCTTLPASVIAGPHSQFFIIDTDEQDHVLGVHFRPGGAFPFFPLPADELRDQHVALDALWGRIADELREQLLEAPTPEHKFALVERFLLARASRPLARHPAVAYALTEFCGAPGERTVGDVTARIGLSSRRFIELFRGEVGLTPKLFCRVRRFQRVIQALTAGRAVEWASVAAGAGYFDQAHFIHDFRAFSGLNPNGYLSRRTEHVNHVPLLD